MSAKYYRNKILIHVKWKIIGSDKVFKLTNLINIILIILNIKLVDLIIFLLSWIKILNCCNNLNWLISLIN